MYKEVYVLMNKNIAILRIRTVLGGYPHTITKTLKPRSAMRNETRLCLWTTETIVRLRRKEPRGPVYIYAMNPLTLLSHRMLT